MTHVWVKQQLGENSYFELLSLTDRQVHVSREPVIGCWQAFLGRTNPSRSVGGHAGSFFGQIPFPTLPSQHRISM